MSGANADSNTRIGSLGSAGRIRRKCRWRTGQKSLPIALRRSTLLTNAGPPYECRVAGFSSLTPFPCRWVQGSQGVGRPQTPCLDEAVDPALPTEVLKVATSSADSFSLLQKTTTRGLRAARRGHPFAIAISTWVVARRSAPRFGSGGLRRGAGDWSRPNALLAALEHLESIGSLSRAAEASALRDA